MGWGAPAAIVQPPGPGGIGFANFIVNAGPVLGVAELNTRLVNLARRWWLNDSEAERRVVIDNFLRVFINRAENALVGVYLERSIPRQGLRNQLRTNNAVNRRVGHGALDFIIGGPVGAPPQPPQNVVAGAAGAAAVLTANLGINPPHAPIWNQCLVIEAKLNLAGANLNDAEWQICAILATLSQMAPPPPPPPGPIAPLPYFYRGILTDGRHWVFYQYQVGLQVFHCTPSIDITGAGPIAGIVPGGAMTRAELVLRMLRKFVLLWNQPNVDGWP
jgi:hypothetical protein